MGNMGARNFGGGCGSCGTQNIMTGGWKYTRRASLASKKRLSARMSKRKKPNKKKFSRKSRKSRKSRRVRRRRR
tara:strand:- start:818 stop:1039 length:222 start_codon:yes stop_codon:yes gene_type:complete